MAARTTHSKLYLTDDDIKIDLIVVDFGVLNILQIKEVIWPEHKSLSYAYDRTKRLIEAGYLSRIVAPYENILHLTFTSLGHHLAQQILKRNLDSSPPAPQEIKHQTTLFDIYRILKSRGAYDWVCQPPAFNIAEGNKKFSSSPDAIFKDRSGKLVLLEYDRTLKAKQRIASRFATFRHLLQTRAIDAVLYITETEILSSYSKILNSMCIENIILKSIDEIREMKHGGFHESTS